MCYSIEPKDRIYVKGYGFLSFAKNIGKNISNKYGQKLGDSAKNSATDLLKTASKRATQNTAEATGGLIGNKIASSSKKSPRELYLNKDNDEIPKEKYISPEKRQQIIDELRSI